MVIGNRYMGCVVGGTSQQHPDPSVGLVCLLTNQVSCYGMALIPCTAPELPDPYWLGRMMPRH